MFVSAPFAAELTVYSARGEHLIKPIFDQYTKKTGTKIRFTTGKAPMLLQKLVSEGKDSKADLLITVDAGNLWQAKQKGLFASVDSPILRTNIPAHLRDPANYWFGLSLRARTIIYNSTNLKAKDLVGYADLAEPKWKNRLCLRTSKKVYNQSLVAMLIEDHGNKGAQKIVEGWIKNLAAPVFSNDSSVINALAAGQCDVGIVNTYYLARIISKNPKLPVKIFWADQSTTGTHVNISGAGVLNTSKNKIEARKFLEWLSSQEAQGLFADLNHEYPANPVVSANSLVKNWGVFKQNKLNVSSLGKKQKEAVMLMDRAQYK